MRIVHRQPSGDRVVEIDIDDPLRTIGELWQLLEGADAPPVTIAVDGRVHACGVPLSAVTMCEGSVIADGHDIGKVPTPSTRALAIVGGVRAGAVLALDRNLCVGRSPMADISLADPALSLRHFTVGEGAGSLDDHHSDNGTSIEGHPVEQSAELLAGAMIRAGTSRLMVRDVVDDVPVAVATSLGARGGSIPFNRPPRRDPPVAPAHLRAPATRPTKPAIEPLSVAGIVLPILVGAVIAVLFSPFMAIFAALGPVLTIGTWWERRRRARRDHRQDMREFFTDLDALESGLPDARRTEIERRRRLHPDPAEVVRRAEGPSVLLWERRPADPDSFVVGIGTDDEPFRPPLRAVKDGRESAVAGEAGALVACAPSMPDVPVGLSLAAGRVVGIVGHRESSMAIARSLVLQMATHHGPADLAIAVGADHPHLWDWCRWLPHTTDHVSGRRGVAVLHTDEAKAATDLVGLVCDRTLLAVLDGHDPFQGRTTVGRILCSSDRTAAIVLVPDAHRLPAECDRVVEVDQLGRAVVVDPRQARPGRRALGWGIGSEIAAAAARRLARIDDPDLPVAGAGVPSSASLLSLLNVSGDDVREIETRWQETDGSADLASPIGRDADGAVILDLVREGPHVLIGGTTGSGKSELLRSLVAGLASSADPDHLAMVLIDYKGGAAFDCCAELPHVAGLVTDLDDDLAARALRCLEAELHYRESRLRDVGAEDLATFRRLDLDADPLPRLVVVVDEFASLARDLPEFLDALVGIAQRGRSLGVHMVLATQRPAGVITDDIRANTSCRIALRVTDRGDSSDVIDAPDAAAIPRNRPGRAIARFGPGELTTFQSALATGRSRSEWGIRIVTEKVRTPSEGPTDLERLVVTIAAAHRARGGGVPRSPWPPELPVDADASSVDAGPGDWLLVDDPDRQRQFVDGWSPDDGPLCVVAGPGLGATTTLAAAALAAVDTDSDRHIHVLDFDGGGLEPLAGLKNTGTYGGPSDPVRRSRLLRWLDDEVTRRRVDPAIARTPMIVLVDDFGGIARAHDPVKEAAVHERINRVWADGPAVGITMAVSLRRAAELSPGLAATLGEVILHRTADQSDALRFGIAAAPPSAPPGRAVRSSDGATVQVLRDSHDLADSVARRARARPPSTVPHEVGELGAELLVSTYRPTAELSARGASLDLGVRDRDLEPAVVTLHRGEHFLVLGPARSGRTNALAAIAYAAGDRAVVVGDGPLARRTGLTVDQPEDLDAVLQDRETALVLVDDCLDVADPSGRLAALVASPPPGVFVVASARPDRFRSAYGHWAIEIKSSRAGVLLRPDPMDGDLLGQQLPTRIGLPPLPGRGLLVVDGHVEVVQTYCADHRRETRECTGGT